jgi:hypothetical protein
MKFAEQLAQRCLGTWAWTVIYKLSALVARAVRATVTKTVRLALCTIPGEAMALAARHDAPQSSIVW